MRVRLQWLNGGAVTVDSAGKPAFGLMEETPGLYRITLIGAMAGTRPRVYGGELADPSS